VPVVIIPSTVAAGAGPTLLTLRQKLADALGFYHATTVTEATGGDPSRIVLSDELRDDERGYPFSGQGWVYVRTGAQAGTQRRVISQPDVGYQGSMGVLVASRPFAAPLETGDIIEVTDPLPVKRHLALKGLNTCIDEALERCWVEAQISLTGNGTDAHDLSIYPYIELGAPQVMGTSDTRWAASNLSAMRSPGRTRIVTNGVTRTLVTDAIYGTSETFTLDVVVRGDRLVFDGTNWFYPTTPGLAGDDWQTAVPERWVITLGMVKALQQLDKMVRMRNGVNPDDRRMAIADIAERRAVWAAAARDIVHYEMPKALPQRAEPFMALADWS